MKAGFIGQGRGEDVDGTLDSSVRTVEASWFPDNDGLAEPIVSAFKKVMRLVPKDLHGRKVACRINDGPPPAGDTLANFRESIAKRFGDVSDVLVVATTDYLLHQLEQLEKFEVCELRWLTDTHQGGGMNILWRTRVNELYEIPEELVGDFEDWHYPADSEGLIPLPPPGDKNAIADFQSSVVRAVRRMMDHHVKHCTPCRVRAS